MALVCYLLFWLPDFLIIKRLIDNYLLVTPFSSLLLLFFFPSLLAISCQGVCDSQDVQQDVQQGQEGREGGHLPRTYSFVSFGLGLPIWNLARCRTI